MSHLLHLDSSLRTDGSRSRKLSAHYAKRWRAKNPAGTITYRDLTVGQLGDQELVIVTARGGGYSPGTPRQGWDHREPWLRHALTILGVDDPVFINTELTLARESPAMAPLDLGAAEDKSLANALAAIDKLVA
jgi:FMN-dependent NADH-azoreductase